MRATRSCATSFTPTKIAHPAEPALDPNKAFAWTAERGILAEAVGVPVGQIPADWNSPVVREDLLRQGFRRRTGSLLVQVQVAQHRWDAQQPCAPWQHPVTPRRAGTVWNFWNQDSDVARQYLFRDDAFVMAAITHGCVFRT